MKAIITKYLPATDTRPSRVKAFDGCGNGVTVLYDDGGNDNAGNAPFARAAVTLCRKMGWTYGGKLISGGTKDGAVFVFANSESYEI